MSGSVAAFRLLLAVLVGVLLAGYGDPSEIAQPPESPDQTNAAEARLTTTSPSSTASPFSTA